MDLEGWLDTWRGPLVGLFAARGVPWAEAAGLARIEAGPLAAGADQ